MRGRSWAAAVVALGIGLGGCGSASVAQPGDAGGGDAPSVGRGDAGMSAGTYLPTTSLEPLDAVEPDLRLAGPRWEVTHLTQGTPPDADPDPGAAVSATEPPREAELEFTAARVLGFAGCVSFDGPATRSGDTIRFGRLQVDPGRCEPDAGPSSRGTVVTDVLSGAVDVAITATAMTLTNASGSGLALLADRPPAKPRDCAGRDCLELDLGPKECDRDGQIVSPKRGMVGTGYAVFDGPATAVGDATPGITLGRSRFDDREPRPSYTYELHARGEDRVLAYRKIDGRVVAVASIGRTQAGGWHLDGTTERTC